MITAVLTRDLSPAFFAKLLAIAGRLACSVWSLLGVMQNESGVFSTAHNPSADANGLIQFMGDTLRGLGWTTGSAAFRELTAEQQLPYVEAYFAPHRGRLVSDAACYLATFLPALLNHAADPAYVLCGAHGPMAWAYAANKSFDHSGKGSIVVRDLADAIERACVGARWEEIVSRMQEVLDLEDVPPIGS